MMAPTAPLARGFRALIVGFAVTAAALVAHLAGHGTAPPLLALLPVALVVAAVVLAFSAQRWNAVALVAVVGVAQIAVHALSVYLTGDEHLTPAMVVTHALATVLTALALAYGERLWWRLWRWASRAWLVLTHASLVPVTRLPGYEVTDRIVPIGCPPPVLVRRGPPLPC